MLVFIVIVAFSCCGGCGYIFNNKLGRSLHRMKRKYKDALARRRLSEMEKERAKKKDSTEESGQEEKDGRKHRSQKESKSSDENGDGKRRPKAALKLRGNPPAAGHIQADKGP